MPAFDREPRSDRPPPARRPDVRLPAASAGLGPLAVLGLQRGAGNRAVAGALAREPVTQHPSSRNPNLTVTPIDDPAGAAAPKARAPRFSWVSKQRRLADGTQVPYDDRLRVGDRLVVRMGVQNVEPSALHFMGSVIVSNALIKESLVVEDTDTGVIEVTFRAVKVGPEHVEMRFTHGGAEILKADVATHVEMSQEDFRGQLQEATQYAGNAYHAANIYMAKASPHYREAWEQVEKTLEKAGDGNPFNELVVHLAVTFIAGLAGGRVAEILEHLKQGIPLTEGLKELAIHATEMGIHFVMPKSAQADLADPGSWVDASHAQIEVEQLAVGAMLEDAIKANNDNRAGFFRDVDVVGAVHGGLTFNGQPMRTLDATPIPSAEEFEKMIWKGWLEGYRGIPDVNDADAWLKIMHRIDDLDEDGYDFVMKYLAEGDKLQRAQHPAE